MTFFQVALKAPEIKVVINLFLTLMGDHLQTACSTRNLNGCVPEQEKLDK